MPNLTVHPYVVVGRVNRSKTFSGTLSYVVGQQGNGNIGSEVSLGNWMNHDLGIIQFENVPSKTFWIARGHSRYGYSHFGDSKHSVLRIYDERTDSEFEISVENLGEILSHYNIINQHIDGELVYAHGTGGKVYLLPSNSEQLALAKDKSKIKSLSVKKSELVPGQTIETKSGHVMVYIGDYYTWQWGWDRGGGRTRSKSGKKKIVLGELMADGKPNFTTYASASSIARVVDKNSKDFEKLWLARESSPEMNEASLDKMISGKTLKDEIDGLEEIYAKNNNSFPWRTNTTLMGVSVINKDTGTGILFEVSPGGYISGYGRISGEGLEKYGVRIRMLSILDGVISYGEKTTSKSLTTCKEYLDCFLIDMPGSTPGPTW